MNLSYQAPPLERLISVICSEYGKTLSINKATYKWATPYKKIKVEFLSKDKCITLDIINNKLENENRLKQEKENAQMLKDDIKKL
ncbi:MAG: hypothetical protein IPQ03_08480 [Bacteroidetes bacterium]|nr:hypothetical protein [Bacteroidota bacterium]